MCKLRWDAGVDSGLYRLTRSLNHYRSAPLQSHGCISRLNECLISEKSVRAPQFPRRIYHLRGKPYRPRHAMASLSQSPAARGGLCLDTGHTAHKESLCDQIAKAHDLCHTQQKQADRPRPTTPICPRPDTLETIRMGQPTGLRPRCSGRPGECRARQCSA